MRFVTEIPDVDPAIAAQLESYEEQIAALIILAHEGGITRREFREQLLAIVVATLTFLFLAGGGKINSFGAKKELAESIAAHRRSVEKLTADVFSGRYRPDDEQTEETAEERLGNRLLLWLFAAAAAYELGHIFNVNGAKRYEWQLGNTEQHCTDCLRLNGQVHTADEWAASGWRPQGRNLECEGWRCDCSLVETTAPVSGGF
jgi:hypothetical protein